RFATPLAKAQLAAALAMLGDRARAEEVFRQALASADAGDHADRRDYGSVLRDRAALVTLAPETRTAWDAAQPLVASLTRAHATRSHTPTQEQAWLLRAARALTEQSRNVRLSVNGVAHTGALNRTHAADETRAGDVVVRNEGQTALD